VEVIDDQTLVGLRADIDFTYDARGRMVQTNEPHLPARTPAPRFLLARSLRGHVARIGATVPDDQARRLMTMVNLLPIDCDLSTPITGLERVRDELATGDPNAREGGGPAYRFPESVSHHLPVVRLAEENRNLLRETFPWLFQELPYWWPCFAVIVDGAAVSVCFSSRRSCRAAEAGVNTLPDFRGRGYAAAVSAAWANAVRRAGRIPIYSTGWDNHASQAVARSLGLKLFGSDVTWS
jgi:hypothetical protein